MSNFHKSSGGGGVQPDVDRSSTTSVFHTTTDIKPPYIMDVWVYLKLNLYVSIHYSRVCYHKSVLCCVSIDIMGIFLKNFTLNYVTDSYKEILKQLVNSNVGIDSIIINTISENLLIKVHHKIIARDQSIPNIPGQKSDKSTPKVSHLPLLFRFHHSFETKYTGCKLFFRKNNGMYKGRELWYHVEITVLK